MSQNANMGRDDGVGGATGALPAGVGGDDDWRAKGAEEVMQIDGGAEALPDMGTLRFPGPVAQDFYFDDGDVIGIAGPVGGGKTTTLLYSRARRARAIPRSTIDGVRRYKLIVVRETYRQLWSTTIPSYLDVFPKSFGEWSGGRGDPVTHVMRFEDEFGPIEMTVMFMAFGDDVVAAMRGIQTTDFWLNEADTMPVDVLVNAITRIDRFPSKDHFGPGPNAPEGYAIADRSFGQIACDFNAPDEENWTSDVFYDEEGRNRMAAELSASLPEGVKPIEINFHRQPGFDEAGTENLQNLSPSYYPRQIAAMKLGGRGDLIERLVHNRRTYIKVGEPVFDRAFSRRIHVADGPLTPPPGAKLRLGFDQGFMPAMVVATFEEPFFWTFYGELMFPKERLLAREFARRAARFLDERFPDHEVEGGWGDMAGEQGSSLAEEDTASWNDIVAQEMMIRIRPQRVGANRIQPRLEHMRAGLEFIEGGRPGVLIDPRCKFLIAGFEARYVWTEEIDRSGDKRKVPDKRHPEANVMDAGQYLTLSEAKPDGATRISAALRADDRRRRAEARPGAARPGLKTSFDVTRPYG